MLYTKIVQYMTKGWDFRIAPTSSVLESGQGFVQCINPDEGI